MNICSIINKLNKLVYNPKGWQHDILLAKLHKSIMVVAIRIINTYFQINTLHLLIIVMKSKFSEMCFSR